MKCDICGRGPTPEHGGITVFRQSPYGEKGIWRCAAHNSAPVDPDVAEIVRLLEQLGNDPFPKAHEA